MCGVSMPRLLVVRTVLFPPFSGALSGRLTAVVRLLRVIGKPCAYQSLYGAYSAPERERIMEEHEYTVTIKGLLVGVSKSGGGTLGKRYEGNWTVTVKNGPVFVYDNEVLHTGMRKTHVQVAQLAFEFASEEI